MIASGETIFLNNKMISTKRKTMAHKILLLNKADI